MNQARRSMYSYKDIRQDHNREIDKTICNLTLCVQLTNTRRSTSRSTTIYLWNGHRNQHSIFIQYLHFSDMIFKAALCVGGRACDFRVVDMI
jgi:hypothetical protein